MCAGNVRGVVLDHVAATSGYAKSLICSGVARHGPTLVCAPVN